MLRFAFVLTRLSACLTRSDARRGSHEGLRDFVRSFTAVDEAYAYGIITMDTECDCCGTRS